MNPIAIEIAPPHFAVVVAMDDDRGIGLQGTLPWRSDADRRHFRSLTMRTRESGRRNAVIMGRKTWSSIPARMRPLLERINIVITRNPSWVARPELGLVPAASSLQNALDIASVMLPETIYVIGGGEIYAQAVTDPYCDAIYVTRIPGSHGCDTFMPRFEEDFVLDGTHEMRGDDIAIVERWVRRYPVDARAAS